MQRCSMQVASTWEWGAAVDTWTNRGCQRRFGASRRRRRRRLNVTRVATDAEPCSHVHVRSTRYGWAAHLAQS